MGKLLIKMIKSLLFLNDHKGEIFVMKWDKKCKLTAMICCALSLGVLSTAFAEFMSVSEVKEGMHGIGKTVIHGTTIDTFDVDVLGVMKNRGANGGDLVLVKVSGSVIDSSNGIAHGMSGSPVYINNKLLGAVAYGFSQSGGRIGMVTPIEDMLKIWAIDDNKVQVDTLKPSKDLIPLNTPLMATGYSSSGLEYLTKKMKNFQMVPYAAASSSEDTTAMPLVPGSSVAATMVTGDLKLGAIGTVTYVDDDHILAFGHPFMSRGNTDYFMHNSYIFTVIPSTYSPFKLGSIGAEIGTINQDRGAGIGGISGRIPSFIPLHTTVFDEDLHSRKDLNVRMINNEKLLPTLTATSVYNAISNTIDREGEGTVSLTYSLYPKDIKKKPFKKSNMYWSTKDISSRSVDEIYNVLDILSENRFEKYDIRQIQVDMSVTKERKTAQILDATATPMIVSPGDTIYIKARLQAYRGDIFYKELTFRVPDDQPYGKMILEIRGGGVTPLPYLIEQQKYNLSDEILDRLRVYKDFDHLQKVLLNENQNNQIVVEILDPNVSMIAKDETSGSSTEIQGKKIITKPEYLHEREKKTQQNEDKNSSKSYVNTDYVIYGDGQFSFTVLPPDKREEALKQMVKKQKELIAEMYREQQSSDLINEEESSD